MLLGLRNNPSVLERLNSEPNLDFIQDYIGGLIDILELPNGINLIFNHNGVIQSGGIPTLILKYSDKEDFDTDSDILIFGDCLFTSHDDLGSTTELDNNQTNFILNNLNLNHFMGNIKSKLKGSNIINALNLTLLDLRAK